MGDRGAALSAVFERLVESTRAEGAAEGGARGGARGHPGSFHGSAARTSRGRQSHATLGLARAILADEIRRARLEQPRYAPQPTGTEVSAFYAGYPDLLVRQVRVSPTPPWLAKATGSRSPRQLRSASSRCRRGEVATRNAARAIHRPAAGAREASRRAAALDRAAGDRRRPPRLRARAVLRELDDQGAGSGSEPDDLPPRSAAAAGRDRPHRVPPLPPDAVGTTPAGHSLAGAREAVGEHPRRPETQGVRVVGAVGKRWLHVAARYAPLPPAARASLHRRRGVHVGQRVFIGTEVFIDDAVPPR